MLRTILRYRGNSQSVTYNKGSWQMTPTFSFQPFRQGLYSPKELFADFDPEYPESYAGVLDVRIYSEFVAAGGVATNDYLTAMTYALHDNAITQHLATFLSSRSVVAIMGGHSASRGGEVEGRTFRDAAHLAAKLAQGGFIVASGGGPGAMEATHLGALIKDENDLTEAIEQLSSKQEYWRLPPGADRLVRSNGSIDMGIASAIGAYLAPAFRMAMAHSRGDGGLGLPTWMYGHEPSTPFASKVAKYFQNSLREDGMLALATHGIIYVEGGPGTLQEVFQDVAQNYYHTFPAGLGAGYFSPMVFFGEFWTKKMPVHILFEVLFGKPRSGSEPPISWQEYTKYVKFTSDRKEAVDFIARFQPSRPNKALFLLRNE
jgi:predicted Rossmann-fold nucleotide-binding protein